MRPMRGKEARLSPKDMEQDLIRVLHVEDDPFDRGLVRESLKASGGFFLAEAGKQADFQRMLEAEEWDCVLTDLQLSGYSGLDVLDRVNALRPGLPVVFLTGSGSEEIAVEAMKKGAADYLLKSPVHYVKLPLVLRNVVTASQSRQETQRVQAALNEREADFRQLFEANPIPMWIYDRGSLRFLEVNEAATRHYGWTREEFLGMKVMEVDEAPGAREYAGKTPGPSAPREVRQHRRKDGSFLFVEASAHDLDWGGVTARVAVLHDITERVRAEEDVRETLAELNTIQQAAPVGILLVSNRVIIRSNDALSRITGYSREELAWKPADVLCLSEDDAHKFWDLAEPQIARTGSYLCDRQIRCKDGTLRWARLVGRAIERTELWKGAIWVIEDHEEARAAQAAVVRLAEDLAQAQRVGRIGSWSRNFDTGEVIYSAEQSRLFGLESSEPPPKSVEEFLRLVHEQDRAAMAEAYDRVIRTGEPEDLDIRAARAGDGERWLHVSMRGERDANGHVFRAFGINQDISEAKKSHQVLERSRDFYIGLFENFPTLVWRASPERSCTFVNAAWTEFTGLPVEKALGRGWDHVTHPEDIDHCHELYRAHFESRTPVLTEYRLRKADGGYRWVRDYGAPYYDGDGRYAGFVGACFDVTDQRTAERNLQESEARLKAILENMPVMLDAFDAQGNIVVWNRECERVTGYGASEIIGNPAAMELLYPDAAYRNAMLEQWKTRGHDYRDWEWTLRAKDGGTRTVLWSSQSEKFPMEGWRTWGTGVDITARRRAEEQLEESENRFRSVIDVAGDGIFIADLDGTIVDFNAAACDRLGYTCEELQRMNVRQVDPKAAELRPEEFRRLHERAMGEPLLWEGTHRRRDGTTFPVQVRISGVQLGDRQYVVGIARDVTEQKRTEEALRRNEERFRALIEESPDFVAIMDQGALLKFVSPSVRTVLGFEPAQVLGRSTFEFVDPADRPLAQATFAELLPRVGELRRLRLRALTASGGIRELDVVARNLMDVPAIGGLLVFGRELQGPAAKGKAQGTA